MAAAGFTVDLYEQDCVIAALLQDALERAADDPALAAAVARMCLHAGEDSIAGLRQTVELVEQGDLPAARAIQYKADRIIYKMCSAHGNLYAVQKEILRRMYGLELGGVREPMPGLIPEDEPIVAEAQAMIEAAIAKL